MQARSLCVVLTHNHLPPPRKKLRIERCPLLPFTAHVLTDRPPRALHHVLHSSTSDGGSSTSEVGPASHRQLVAYFRSGWAFLIPYLAAYLLYAWLKWPVNPVAAGSSTVGEGQLAVSAIGALPSTVTPSTAHGLLSTGVPCLLHVYWFLHALHLVLGALALRAWWRESGATVAGATDDSENTANHSATSQPLVSPKSDVVGSTDSPSTVHRAAKPLLSTVPQSGHRPPPALRSSASSEVGSTVYRLLPWLLLALFFYIPGVYLEFPADPWMHLGRITEWANLNTIHDHTTWNKTSYFLPYSLLAHLPASQLLFGLNFYYTGICLLLCWQYFRLSQTVGMGRLAGFIFVLLQTLLLGNTVFGFYRYYGISSSIIAQIGAVSLVRLGLVIAQSSSCNLKFCTQKIASVALALIALIVLTAFLHGQALGIAALGLTAVIIWRLIQWKRAMIGWLLIAAFGLSVIAIFWWPHDPAIDQVYRPERSLTSWYGFNLFSLDTITGNRMMEILGLIGVINLLAGLVLLYRNHVVGWLTIMPPLALSLPFVAIPFIGILVRHANIEGILSFNRMFFAIPAGMALVCLAEKIVTSATLIRILSIFKLGPAVLLIGLSLLALTSTPTGKPFYNHFWNALESPPNDMSMRPIWENYAENVPQLKFNQANTIYATSSGLGAVLKQQVRFPTAILCADRSRNSPSYWLEAIDQTLNQRRISEHIVVVVPKAIVCYTPYSAAAFASGHWGAQEHIFGFAGANELTAMSTKYSLQPIYFPGDIIYYQNK